MAFPSYYDDLAALDFNNLLLLLGDGEIGADFLPRSFPRVEFFDVSHLGSAVLGYASASSPLHLKLTDILSVLSLFASDFSSFSWDLVPVHVPVTNSLREAIDTILRNVTHPGYDHGSTMLPNYVCCLHHLISDIQTAIDIETDSD
jgi:hypothetical protein